jgi:tRNA threonylcarbamoyladenosine biosynthesis protein TsaE
VSTAVLHQSVTTSAAETRALGSGLGRVLAVGDLVVLTGDLGAGKTQFTKGIADALGITVPVTSPTFALHQQYEGRRRLHHLDVYRLDALDETLDLDLPELLDSGVTVIEWGDSITPVLPADRLTVRLVLDEQDDDRRVITFEAGPSGVSGWKLRLSEAFGEVPC